MGTGPLSLGLSMWRRHRKDPGLELLKGSALWASTQAMTLAEETVTVSSPFAVAMTITTGQADPWGGTTAWALTPTAANTSHRFEWTRTFATGEVWELEYYFKPGGVETWQKVFTPFLQGPFDALSAVCDHPSSNVHMLVTANQRLKADVLFDPLTGWYRVRQTFVGRNNGTNWFVMAYGGAIATDGLVACSITPPVFTRKAVASMANLGSGSAVIAQATAAKRPDARPVWGALPAMAFEADSTSMPATVIPGLLSGAGTAFVASLVIEPTVGSPVRGEAIPASGSLMRLTGATASLELRLSTAGVLSLLRTDDAATATTATLPVTVLRAKQVIQIAVSGTSVQLYVQGKAKGAAQAIGAGAATFTACELGGTTAIAKVVEWHVDTRALTAAQIRDVASTLATRTGFSTAPIPLWIGVSQSNGLYNNNDLSQSATADQTPFPFSMLRIRSSGDTHADMEAWGMTRPRVYQLASRKYSENANAYTSYTFTFQGASARCAIAHFGIGGNPIANFRNGGSMWVEQIAFLHDALDDLTAGGFDFAPMGLINIHGEDDSTLEARALAFGTNLEGLRTDLETELGISLPLTLEPRVNDATTLVTCPYLATTRATLLTWQAASPTTRILIDIDDLALKADNIHWALPTVVEAGKRLAARLPRAS